MESIQTVLQLVLYGARDCIYCVLALKDLYFKSKDPNKDHSRSSQSKIKKLEGNRKTVFEVLTQCLLFGIAYWLAIFIFNNFIVGYCYKHLNSLLTPEEVDSISWVPGLLGVIFSSTWTMPLFFISRILNYSWYQEIADLTYETAGIKKSNRLTISYSLSDQITSTAIEFLFLVQGYMVFLLPVPAIIQAILSLFHMSLLYSLYAFEYKWVQKGWSISKRLNFIDSKWPYFVGFGFPLAFLTSYVGTYLESICLFSTLFPFYVISTTITFSEQLKTFNHPLRVFRAVICVSDFVTNRICSLMHR